MEVAGDARRFLGAGDDSGACFQYLNGRLVQTWTSATSPMAPERMTSAPRRNPIGCPLVAHLGTDALLPGGLAHEPCLPDRMRQRFLAIDMLAQPHGGDRGGGVVMVGPGDGDCVDLEPCSSSSLRSRGRVSLI